MKNSENYASDPTGHDAVNETKKFSFPGGISIDVKFGPPPESAGVKSIGRALGIDGLASGVIYVSGGTASGKTTLVREIIDRCLQEEDYCYVSAAEALSQKDMLDLAKHPAHNLVTEYDAVIPAIIGASESVVIVDSLRDLVWRLPGSARSQGVANTLGTFITQLHNAAAYGGKLVIATLNPSLEEGSGAQIVEGIISESAYYVVLLSSKHFGVAEVQNRSDRSRKKKNLDFSSLRSEEFIDLAPEVVVVDRRESDDDDFFHFLDKEYER